MVVEFGEQALHAVDGFFKERRLAGGEAERRALHGFREGGFVAELLDEREDELADNAVHLLGGQIFESAPT